MASGITHILLMKNLQSILPEGKLKKLLQSGRDFLQVGAVGPDLPYASIADDDLFFKTQSELADKFHYEKTNELILRAFQEIKTNSISLTAREKRFMFSFFLGFASHIVADGIIHPFVRDKVGNYKENQTAHRVLEMQLDVLLLHHLTLTSNNPINLNNSKIYGELINFDNNFYPEVGKVLQLFSKLIAEVYQQNYEPALINGWVNGLHRMFGVAEGEHPKIYKIVGFINDFLFSDYNDLREKYKDILVLEKPTDREYNFLRKDQIHFFDDCLPQFYKIIIPLADKCYDYVYNNKGELTESDIPPIDLDTGRNLASNNNLDLTPTLWSLT
ncbi:MAG: zinc dependent phospholipase C family protein [Ignavibacteriaceae bacterium]|nr:zinc dependent phospholipase C family protein [Ignavibacteriaceae bacterium]